MWIRSTAARLAAGAARHLPTFCLPGRSDKTEQRRAQSSGILVHINTLWLLGGVGFDKAIRPWRLRGTGQSAGRAQNSAPRGYERLPLAKQLSWHLDIRLSKRVPDAPAAFDRQRLASSSDTVQHRPGRSQSQERPVYTADISNTHVRLGCHATELETDHRLDQRSRRGRGSGTRHSSKTQNELGRVVESNEHY